MEGAKTMSLFAELQRRNVFKVAAAYIIVGWLIMQAGEVMSPALNLPGWVNSMLAFFLILGFPLAMIFAWAFEMTPEGLKKEKDIDRQQSITNVTGRKLDFTIIGLMAVALVYFIWESRFQTGDAIPSETGNAIVEQQSTTPTSTDVSAEMPQQPKVDNNSIAVLPFINMSDDASNEFFSDGITEELLNLLAKIPELKVTSRSSAFSFKGQSPHIPTVAKKLKVAHILEGSVRKAGNRVRITAQLIKADTDVHLWSETYDRELDDVFAIQDEIATEVVNALRIHLLGDAPTTTATDTEAYTQYLKGKYFAPLDTLESWEAAEAAYRAAIAISPDFAPAWAGLSTVLGDLANQGYIDLDEGQEAARQAATRALELDDTLADAWAALANIQFAYDWDWNRAEGTIRTALQYGPRDVETLEMAAGIFRGLGQFEQALKYARLAVELDPLSLSSLRTLGITLWASGQHLAAEKAYHQLLELYPQQVTIKAFVAVQLMLQGKPEESIQFIIADSENVWQRFSAALILHDLGRDEDSNRILQSFINDEDETWAYQIADIFAWRDNPAEAFEWLDIAIRHKDGGMTLILYDPFLGSLHADPHWEPMLNKIGMLKYWQEMRIAQEATTQ
jgi:TolB-like protein/cytochrome c-type biogenesis protein CcmH/NrfG